MILGNMEFRIATEADLSGIKKLQGALDDLFRTSQKITQETAKWGSGGVNIAQNMGLRSSSSGGNVAKPSQSGKRNAPQYNLDTQSGLYAWSTEVYDPIAAILSAATQAYAGNSSTPMHTTVPTRRTAGSLASTVAGRAGGVRVSGTAGEMLGAVGQLAKNHLGMFTAAGSVLFAGAQVKQGYDMWTQSATAFSSLTHSISQASMNVNEFRSVVSAAGAKFGETLQQSAASAAVLTQSFGAMSQQGLANAVGGTARFAFVNGLSPSQASQLMATSATLGLTSGVGSTLSQGAFQNLMTNGALAAHMAGRQSSYMNAFSGVASTIGTMNPILANPQGVAGALSVMGASGIQGFQGARGEAALNQFVTATMNGNSYQKGLGLAAILKSSHGTLTNPIQALGILQSGPFKKIPGTNITVGSSEMSFIRSQSSNPLTQASMMVAAGLANSIPQAEQWLKLHKTFSTEGSTAPSKVPVWRSLVDWLNHNRAGYQNGLATIGGNTIAPFTTGFYGLGAGVGLGTTVLGAWAGGRLLRRMGSSFFGRVGPSLAADVAGASRVGSTASLISRIAPYADTMSKVARGIPLVGAVANIASARLSGHSWGDASAQGIGGAIGGFLGAAIPVPGLDVIGSIAGSWLGSKVGGGVYHLIHGPSQQARTQAIHDNLHASAVSGTRSLASTQTIKSLTIDTLKINQVMMPTNAKSNMGLGNAYAPTSNGGLGQIQPANWWQRLTTAATNLITGGTGGAQNGQVIGAQGGVSQYLPQINKYSKQYGVPANIAAAIMQTESSGRMYGSNGKILTSSTGALGLMQLEPQTAQDLGVNPYNVNSNIQGGVKYLGMLHNKYGTWANAIEAYYAGHPGTAQGQAYLNQVEANEKTVKIHPSSVQAIGKAIKSPYALGRFGPGRGVVMP